MNLLENSNHSLVYDLGTSTIQFGFAGSSLPLNKVPTCAALISEEDNDYQFGDEWLQRDYKTMIKAVPFVIDGEPSNQDPPPSDILTTFFDWAVFQANCEPSQTPVLVSQPSGLKIPAMLQWRRQVLEILFDFASHPQVSLQHDATLACYSVCRDTALVIDFGWSGIRVVPIYEGHPIKNAIKQHPLGGLSMTQMLDELLQNNSKPIRTLIDTPLPCHFSSNYSTFDPNNQHDESQILYCRRRVLDDMLQSRLYFGPPPKSYTIRDSIYYMAGHQPVDLQKELQTVAKGVFESNENSPSLQTLVCQSLDSIPINLRSKFLNIVIAGGLSKAQGFKDEVMRCVSQILPKEEKISIIPPVNNIASGSLAVWVGGSIVASMDTFSEMCISQKEWSEEGVDHIIEKRCI